jgi:hypothetical protein
VPFFVCLYAHPIFMKRVGIVRSWIIECLLMHEHDDAHVFSSDQEIFWCVFDPLTLKYA